jgi:hypothetical protein
LGVDPAPATVRLHAVYPIGCRPEGGPSGAPNVSRTANGSPALRSHCTAPDARDTTSNRSRDGAGAGARVADSSTGAGTGVGDDSLGTWPAGGPGSTSPAASAAPTVVALRPGNVAYRARSRAGALRPSRPTAPRARFPRGWRRYE